MTVHKEESNFKSLVEYRPKTPYQHRHFLQVIQDPHLKVKYQEKLELLMELTF
ncbi:hypothetical protein CULT_200021 [[Clostridium] ultunense Esp]|nr:hypothetical protein CULT_200021 [[Clostridium] ultunense Esp]